MAYVEIENETPKNRIDDWQLCFQQCVYHYDDGTQDTGYRFIWRRPDGSLQAARGQARIPDKAALNALLRQASDEGWYK